MASQVVNAEGCHQKMVKQPSRNIKSMSREPTATAKSAEEDASYPDQDWGKIAFCVGLAIIAALAIHYVAFEILVTGMNLSPTLHALVGMVLFFIAGFASFSIFY